MSIRQGLLALLEQGPRYGYQLRTEFTETLGDTWPLNVGQVYSTLARLERDGMVVGGGEDADGRILYTLTPDGHAEVTAWFAEPVPRESRPRDELAIKLALAVTVPGVDVRAVIQAQRSDSIRALQDYTRLKARADGATDLAWLLVLDAMVFQTEAEVRWLDHCEARLARFRPTGRASEAPAATELSVPAIGSTR